MFFIFLHEWLPSEMKRVVVPTILWMVGNLQGAGSPQLFGSLASGTPSRLLYRPGPDVQKTSLAVAHGLNFPINFRTSLLEWGYFKHLKIMQTSVWHGTTGIIYHLLNWWWFSASSFHFKKKWRRSLTWKAWTTCSTLVHTSFPLAWRERTTPALFEGCHAPTRVALLWKTGITCFP